MKKLITLFLVLSLALCGLTSCGNSGEETKKLTIAIPNDTTNEARALLLLEANGYIKLKEGAGITATILDIVSNPKNIEFTEIEAAQIPRMLPDFDYAVINSNYAIEAGINPMEKALVMEGGSSAYANIIAVHEDKVDEPWVKALMAAVTSKEVVDFINDKYNGAVVPAVEKITNGYDDSISYDELSGTIISVAASITPHAEILEVAKGILEKKNISLEIFEYTDYVLPNQVVESGEIMANFFQHVPYLDDFNKQNGTHIASAGTVHVEPMGLYGGKQASLDALK